MVIPEKEERVEAELQGYEGLSIPQVFDAQADRRPDKVWLVHGKERLTFREFSQRTDRSGRGHETAWT